LLELLIGAIELELGIIDITEELGEGSNELELLPPSSDEQERVRVMASARDAANRANLK
jgi:hypothetical protein